MFHSELGFINLNFDFFKKGFGLRQEEPGASSRRAWSFVKKSLGLRQEELGASSRRAWSFIKKSLGFINKSFSFASLRLSLQTDCPLFDLTLWWLLCPTLFQLLLSFFLRITNNARCKVNYFLSICNLFTLFSFKCDRKRCYKIRKRERNGKDEEK